jgi:hypothetical protein
VLVLTTTKTVIKGETPKVQMIQNGRTFFVDIGVMPASVAEAFIKQAMSAHRARTP